MIGASGEKSDWLPLEAFRIRARNWYAPRPGAGANEALGCPTLVFHFTQGPQDFAPAGLNRYWASKT
jgi:hypothetical protein